MKAMRQFYMIVSYVMFILPPFIWGLVVLYADNPDIKVHIISLFVNLIVLTVLGLIASILMKKEILHLPSSLEIRYLLFGLVGNIVVYFYTFQNMMNIENIVTIYLILLIVLAVRYFLITKQIRVWELWIILPIFLLVDTLHLRITGCTVLNNDPGWWRCIPNRVDTWILYLLYTTVVLSTIGYYGYKIFQYKRYTFWGISHMALVLFIAIYAQEFVPINEKLMGTISILAAFLVVLDFIVSFVNKTYTHRTLIFYLRTGTFLVLSMLLVEEGFFRGDASKNMLILMVITTYASLGIAILKFLLQVQEEVEQLPFTDIEFRLCDEELCNIIKEQYGDVAYNHIKSDDQSYNVIALKDDVVIGFISTYLQPIYKNVKETKEAYINIIEVHEAYRRQQVATELLRRTELHFKRLGAKQIRAWSSEDKEAAIQMWNALGYQLSATTIYIKQRDTSVSGVYAVKPL